MSLSEQLKTKIDAAIKKFGEYTYRDKGLHEIMDTEEVVTNLFAGVSAKDVGAAIDQLYQSDANKYGIAVVDLMSELEIRDDYDAIWESCSAIGELF